MQINDFKNTHRKFNLNEKNDILNNSKTYRSINTRIPPIIGYQSFIVSNIEKTLNFSSLDTGILYNPLSADSTDRDEGFEIFFPTDTELVANETLRLQFSNIFFNGTLRFDISGTIKLSSSSEPFTIHLDLEIEPDYYFLHDLAFLITEKIESKI